jgi:hypothetical protein
MITSQNSPMAPSLALRTASLLQHLSGPSVSVSFILSDSLLFFMSYRLFCALLMDYQIKLQLRLSTAFIDMFLNVPRNF